MKKLGIIFVLTLSLVSCLSNDPKATSGTGYYGKWTLEKMNVRNENVTVDKLQWQENYDFNTDGTFTKTRIKEGKTTTGNGKFVVKKIDNETNFELTYNEKTDIVGSCLGDLTESLSLNKENSLVSNWQMCDGPGLIYKKSK